MRIAFVSPHDFQGGASRIGYYLFNGMRQKGHTTAFFVGKKSLEDQDVYRLSKYQNSFQKLFGKLLKRLHRELGHEHFYFPNTPEQILKWKPDIIHFHNPQGGYFDVRALEKLSNTVPVVLTLHDPWMFSGHCSYFIHCEKWKSGCGACPDLKRRPSLKRDGTAYNWSRKKKIYEHSKFHVVTPSAWLMDEAKKSIVNTAIQTDRVINNGVDHEIFKPGASDSLRAQLGIPEGETVLLYVVNSHMQTNPYKDFTTISKALEHLKAHKKPEDKFTFVALGTDGEGSNEDGIRTIYAGFQRDPAVIAQYFNLADLYLHAARAENYPNVVMEALACGTPCVVTKTGGVPEQIIEGKTGWVVPFEGSKEMAETVIRVSRDKTLLNAASVAAREWVQQAHTLDHMIEEYLDFYTNLK